MKNHLPSGPKSGSGCLQEVVVHLEAPTVRLDWKNFVVLDWRLLMAWEVVAYEKSSHMEVRLSEQLAHLKKEINANAYRHNLCMGVLQTLPPFIYLNGI